VLKLKNADKKYAILSIQKKCNFLACKIMLQTVMALTFLHEHHNPDGHIAENSHPNEDGADQIVQKILAAVPA
jgi:hypothetical protein